MEVKIEVLQDLNIYALIHRQVHPEVETEDSIQCLLINGGMVKNRIHLDMIAGSLILHAQMLLEVAQRHPETIMQASQNLSLARWLHAWVLAGHLIAKVNFNIN